MRQEPSAYSLLGGPIAELLRAALSAGIEPDLDAIGARFPTVDREDIGFLAEAIRADVDLGRARAEQKVAVDEDRSLPEIDGFEVLREIGRGGMAVVYAAVERTPGRAVALKVFDPTRWRDDPVRSTLVRLAAEKFREEIERMGRLRHDGIVPVFRAGTDRGRHYFTMPLIEGKDLGQVIRELRALRAPGGGT
jgi:hypothetical protein